MEWLYDAQSARAAAQISEQAYGRMTNCAALNLNCLHTFDLKNIWSAGSYGKKRDANVVNYNNVRTA